MFFTFDQNNSGGRFRVDQKVTEFVIIEAIDANHANSIAESIGIYFDGCEKGFDCSCCGDRWYRTNDYAGKDKALLYGKDPSDYKSMFIRKGYAYCYVRYLDRTVKHLKK